MGPREALSKAVAIRRELGWRVLFWRILGFLGFRRVVLFRRGIEAAARIQPPQNEVEFDRLEREALGDYLEFRPDAELSELETRFEAGDSCHVARTNGRIVAARWSSTREVRIGYLGYRSELPAGEAYLYDAYTTPAFRRRGISVSLSRHIFMLLHEQGVQDMLSAADPANPAGSGFNRSTGTPVATLIALGRRHRRLLTLGPPRAGR
jgi:ribosomal protein S18 acetylase RimI-like enzyme